jgi:hypothetical protein
VSEDEKPLYMSNEQVARLLGGYTDPRSYEVANNEESAKTSCPYPHRRHGKNLRGSITWLIWGAVLLLWPFYVKFVGLSLPDWAIWLFAGLGWAFVVFGAMIVCNEWRKEV